MGEGFENAIKVLKNLKDIRSNCSEMRQYIADSLSPPKSLICSIMTHMQLKGTKFQNFESASDAEMNSFFNVLLQIDLLLT